MTSKRTLRKPGTATLQEILVVARRRTLAPPVRRTRNISPLPRHGHMEDAS